MIAKLEICLREYRLRKSKLSIYALRGVKVSLTSNFRLRTQLGRCFYSLFSFPGVKRLCSSYDLHAYQLYETEHTHNDQVLNIFSVSYVQQDKYCDK